MHQTDLVFLHEAWFVCFSQDGQMVKAFLPTSQVYQMKYILSLIMTVSNNMNYVCYKMFKMWTLTN